MGKSYNPLPSFLKMIVSNRGRNGGYVVHLAILALAINDKFFFLKSKQNIEIDEPIPNK